MTNWWQRLLKAFRNLDTRLEKDPSKGTDLERLARPTPSKSTPRPAIPSGREAKVEALLLEYGLRIIESDPKGNARPLSNEELDVIFDTVSNLGPEWYGPFQDSPINFWIDRNPGGGGYGDGWLRIGETYGDTSILYRILIHEGTHASNEFRGWLYETRYCFRPGLDWRKGASVWTHPRQQGTQMQQGSWETLPVDTRDVSVAPGEDLAEMVRYYVHSVKNEREYLWPLDRSRPATYLWDTSPTRHVFVRDIFLKLPPDHDWYKLLTPEMEAKARRNLGLA